MSRVIINIFNSFSYLEGEDEFLKSALTFLRLALRYIKPGSGFASKKYTGFYKPSYVYLVDKNFRFPTGLIRLAIKCLKDNSFNIEIKDCRKQPETNYANYRIFNKFPELRYYQKEAIAKALEQKRGVLEMATGSGKSVVIYNLIKEFGVKKVLILVPNLSILSQMHKQLCHFFSPKKVSICGGGKKDISKDIVLGTPQSILPFTKELNETVNLLLIDEAHHSSAETIRTINQELENVFYRFYFSGTAFRNGEDELELIGAIGEKIYEYDTKKAIADGFLTSPIFLVYDLKHQFEDFETWAEELDVLIKNEAYNLRVAEIVNNIKDKKILVFVERVVHGKILSEMIPGSIFIHGQSGRKYNDDALQNFALKGPGCLVATSKLLGEGVDIPSAEIAVLASCGKARSNVIQMIGRFLRKAEGKKFALIVDFTHKGAKYLNRHAKLRQKEYKKYNTKIFYKESV